MKKNYFLRSLRLVLAGSFMVTSSLVFVACSDQGAEEATPAGSITDTSAAKADDAIAGKYIVVLKDGAELAINENASYSERVEKVKTYGKGLLKAKGMRPEAISHAYGKVLKGFAADLTPAEAAALQKDDRVAYVEQDKIIALGKPTKGGTTPSTQTIPAGITRVGYGDGTGKTAWVIDTGIDLDHPDLNVDVARSKSFLTSGANYASPDDGNGHGSHVAGTIAAKNNTIGVVGVAANASVVAVRVLDARGSGSTSGVIAGVDYVGANGQLGDVANMSLGGGVSQALDDAVLKASANVLFALAAGNETDNANNHSPARVNGANIYTISAMDASDTFAYFSNFGNPPVDYCMPGVSIQSTWMNGGYNTISGTSMATPHMAGVLLMKGKSFTTSGAVKNDPDGNADPIAHL